MDIENIKKQLIEYLKEKDIILEDTKDALFWSYKKNDIDYSLKIYFRFSKNGYMIKYKSYANISKSSRTHITKNYCERVYKRILIIKYHMDQDAEKRKINADLKNKYTTELYNHYKKFHDDVTIYLNKDKLQSDDLGITVYCHDLCNKQYKEIVYSIRYKFKENKYYLVCVKKEFNELIN